MRGTLFRRSAGALTLCLGTAALFNCALDVDGKLDLSPPEGSGGVGGEGGGMGAPVGGASGAEAGGGQAGSAMGMGGAGSAGAGGDSGGAGAGGGVVPTVPNELGCKPWLPGNPAWRFAGDTAQDGKRIELTPAGKANQWGQAYFDFGVTPTTSLEIAFTFAFEPREVGGDFDEGAAFWLARGDGFSDVPPASTPAGLGVPTIDLGLAIGLDMRDSDPPPGRAFWGFYVSDGGDGSTLGGEIASEARDGFVDASELPPEGPHTALVRMVRDGSDNLDITLTVKATPAPAPLLIELAGGALLFSNSRIGFSAGTGEGGALHRLLGAEIKVDGTCREPPSTLQVSGGHMPSRHYGLDAATLRDSL